MSEIWGTTRLGSISNWNPLNHIERIPQCVCRGGWERFALLGESNWFHCAREDQSIPIKVIESSTSRKLTQGWETPNLNSTVYCVLKLVINSHKSNLPEHKTNPKCGASYRKPQTNCKIACSPLFVFLLVPLLRLNLIRFLQRAVRNRRWSDDSWCSSSFHTLQHTSNKHSVSLSCRNYVSYIRLVG